MPDISPPPTKRRRLSPCRSTPPPTTSIPPATTSSSQIIPDLSLLRIFAWNINGITPFLQPSITTYFNPTKKRPRRSSSTPPRSSSSPSVSSHSLRGCLRRWGWPEVLCLQEVKIAAKDTKTQQAVARAVNLGNRAGDGPEDGPAYSTHFCLPRDKYNAKGFGGKVYGVCTLVRRDFLKEEGVHEEKDNFVKQVDWDLEGRVLVLELPRQKMALINIYAVNGTSNPYRSPITGAVTGTRHDRKRAFHTALAQECSNYTSKGWNIIIAGDLNIARGPQDGWPGRRMGEEHVKNRFDFEKKFMEAGLGMVDSFRRLHTEERRYTYRPRGREWGSSADRVDLILLSEGAGLVEAGMLDNEIDRGPSDHVPLFVGLKRGLGLG